MVTVKTNLASPTGPKLRRKTSAEPTMTLHTKAATEDILDIFNQPLRNVDPLAPPQEEEADSDYDDEDDYTSGGESTGTGRISGTSDFGDTQPDIVVGTADSETGVASVSPWSEFTASKHVPRHDDTDNEDATGTVDVTSTVPSENQTTDVDHTNNTSEPPFVVHEDSVGVDGRDEVNAVTPILPSDNFKDENEAPRTRYIPLPPEDYEPPVRYVRDPEEVAQNRLPFMTPIAEKTESSVGAFTIGREKDYFNSKTPSRKMNGYETPLINEEVLSSPLREIINEARPEPISKLNIAGSKPTAAKSVATLQDGAIIKDAQCNPVDDSIRKTILESIQPPLSSYAGYHDHRPASFNKGPEIRKYINALKKAKSDSKTLSSLPLPPTIQFPSSTSPTYTIKRELGKGAFAPVYLASVSDSPSSDDTNPSPSPPPLLAIKCEDPPTPWEFYIMSTLHTRLSSSPNPNLSIHPSTLPSLCSPTALHLFHDECYLLETYLDQGTLLDLINLTKSDPQPTLDEPIAMFFTIELLRSVEALHSAGILHGDLKADNCLVRLPPSTSTAEAHYRADGSGGWAEKGLTLIDFGRGIDMRAFQPKVQFLADWKTGKQDCVEMRECRPWTWQVDYWGVAGVVHSLLFGKYIEDAVVTTVGDNKPAPLRKKSNTNDVENEDEDSDSDAADIDIDTPAAALDRTIPIPTNSRARYRLREPLKRYWQTELWAPLFDLLLNPGRAEEGMPCSTSLGRCREAMERWLEGEGGRRGQAGLRGGLGRLEGRLRGRGR